MREAGATGFPTLTIRSQREKNKRWKAASIADSAYSEIDAVRLFELSNARIRLTELAAIFMIDQIRLN